MCCVHPPPPPSKLTVLRDACCLPWETGRISLENLKKVANEFGENRSGDERQQDPRQKTGLSLCQSEVDITSKFSKHVHTIQSGNSWEEIMFRVCV